MTFNNPADKCLLFDYEWTTATYEDGHTSRRTLPLNRS
jgi:hypothetical protein